MGDIFDPAIYTYGNVISLAGQLGSNTVIVQHVIAILSLGWLSFIFNFVRKHAKPR